ncbi:peptidyl-prolyl cis-trans isomerase [Methyloceanibacter sp. wino2]|uniref:peptidylprolyl isomerase n=1 Tax=Methyloceanibacter sp. wino2 TaxID=2170729 RepID=UPI00131EF3E2|nr:peptidylprolyl isomerase [Methyloceanibacter sp. wino2]
MRLLSRLVREPLFHFVLIGAAVFAAYAFFADGDETETRDRIVVTEGRVLQLAQVFAKTWQRPPTPEEIRGLLDAYIKEEVYYREAVKRGLDRDDTLIRRRMQQKMEFLSEPSEEALAADDVALQAYLDDHKDAYRVEPKLAFEQVFINPKLSGGDADARAAKMLQAVKAGADPGDLGDPTLLPRSVPLSPLRAVQRDFGDDFASDVLRAPEGEWTGPIASPFGLHLVQVTKREGGYDPELDEVRDAVRRDWRNLKRKEYQADAYDRLRAKYEVVLPELKSPQPEAPLEPERPPQPEKSSRLEKGEAE